MVTRNGLITLLAMGTTTIAAYVFQTVMARLMSTLEYGELSSIVAALNIATIPVFGISMAVTRDVATRRIGTPGQLGALLGPYAVRIGIFTALMLAGLVLLSPWLTGFLQLSSFAPLAFLGVLVAMTNILGAGRAVLLGLHDFVSLAINQVAESLVRLVAAVAIATLGSVAMAGLGGYSVGLLAALFLIGWRLPAAAVVRLIVPWWQSSLNAANKRALGASHERDISWSAIIVTGTFIVLLNIDLVVVKHFLLPDQAGQYAAISTLAKGLFVITNAFDIVLFPAAAAARSAGGNELGHLRRAVLSVGAIVVPILAVYWLIGGPLVNLFFGPRYVGVASLLGPYGVAITFLGLSTLLARYRLAIGRAIPSAALVGVVFAAAAAFLVFHDTLAQVVGVLMVTAAVTLALGLSGALARA
jgi:O-antigen/teichoic acid export membrane protein